VQRKTVTVLFCDVTGSTALGESVDPEALRALLARYFERMSSIVERHGGTTEKFIGDAVMAIFGVPVAHEDDALRAVRAAAEMRDALPELGIQARIGVNTGEVVTGSEERLATGDAINVAARLEQAAQAGEVLVGESTAALVREAAELDEVEPLALKGKSRPVAAYRLRGVRETLERRHETPFVGRERELGLVRAAWDRVQAECRCELVTITADAGVGKSRLLAESLAPVEARVVRGRCLPYGEGITYWPVVEVVKQLDLEPEDEAVAAALRALLGESELQTSAEEIAWAVRKTFEQAAREQPLAVVFEDVHWGEETFLDLVEHVSLLSAGAPILLACLGRPELLERRPQWPVSLRLEPLPDADVDELIPPAFSGDARARIARSAGGNPLFVTELLAMAGDGGGDVAVPPTLQALLAARLDQLDPAERKVLERGAVEGEVFHRGAVQALCSEEQQVTPRLASLVRRQLITPDTPFLPGEDGFRFRHLLVREAAYEALPKSTRADLHERYARWLEAHGSTLVELDEIAGFHLERAHRYRHELGLDEEPELAAAARAHLAAAGVRARARGDDVAAINLLGRAAALGPDGEIELALELDLLDALYWAGRATDAVERARSLDARAVAAADRIAELCARIKTVAFGVDLAPEGTAAELETLLEEALSEFEASGDDVALVVAYTALGVVKNMHGQMDALADAYERAAVHAARAGRPYEFLAWRATGRMHGTAKMSDLLAWLEEQEARGVRDHRLEANKSRALAMLGRLDEARELRDEVLAKLTERAPGHNLAGLLGPHSILLERFAGNPAAAAESGLEAVRLFERLGARSYASTAMANLAQALYESDHLDEAAAWADRSAEAGASDDRMTQILSRQVKARLLARRGDHAQAEELARAAVSIAAETDMLNEIAEAHAALGDVFLLAGRADEAAAEFGEALTRYERKENLVMAERMRTRLAELRAAPAKSPGEELRR
jgi:class 3 adenylate cyclase/tetratricopeptide (TPR) repeat protein